MDREIDDLLGRLHDLEEEFEQKLAERSADFRYRFDKKRVVFEDAVRAQHRELKTGLLGFLRSSHWSVLLTAPVVYSLVVLIALADLWVTLYQAICFPIWRIPRVRRSDYISLDRRHLAYLNVVQKLNCLYCGYANGVLAYMREVASKSEQYWCPIKHALRVKTPHKRYRHFVDYGDAEGFRDRFEALRDQVREGASELKQ